MDIIYHITLYLLSRFEEMYVGIDLGTTNSSVALYENKKITMIEDFYGEYETPSIVSFTDDGLKIGKDAKHFFAKDDTFYNIKRLIGRYFNEKSVQEDLKNINYEICSDDKDRILLKLHNEKYKKDKITPEHISALILNYLNSGLQRKLPHEAVLKTVISVPSSFNDYQRRATVEAGRIGGFDILSVISEPTAAAIAFMDDLNYSKERTRLLVFDFGGGTLDVSILNISGRQFKVCSTVGDSHLGGSDIDACIVQHVIEYMKEAHSIDLREEKNEGVLRNVRELAEQAKINLSANSSDTRVFYINDERYSFTLTQATLKHICEPLIPRIKAVINKALELGKYEPFQIFDVVMVGGSSRIPFVKEVIRSIFFKDPTMSTNSLDLIAKGAAIYAESLICKEKTIEVIDINPMPIGIAINNSVKNIIPPSTPLPYQSPYLKFIGVKKSPFILLKVYEGDSIKKEECHLVSTNRIKAHDFIDKKPYAKIAIKIERSMITLCVKSVLKEEKIVFDSINDAHTEEEIAEIQKDIMGFLHATDDVVSDVTLFKNALSKAKVRARAKAKGKAAKEKVGNIISSYIDWCKKNPSASESDILEKKKLIEQELALQGVNVIIPFKTE